MNLYATVEINVFVLLLLCVLAYIGLGMISRMFMPKIRYWAVVDPDDYQVVYLHGKRENAESVLNGKRYLVELEGILKL
ncbi:MAG: hypothetical protein AB9919_02190 [Geobacteraceae bacterium]